VKKKRSNENVRIGGYQNHKKKSQHCFLLSKSVITLNLKTTILHIFVNQKTKIKPPFARKLRGHDQDIVRWLFAITATGTIAVATVAAGGTALAATTASSAAIGSSRTRCVPMGVTRLDLPQFMERRFHITSFPSAYWV
jgi:hypothetical protein